MWSIRDSRAIVPFLFGFRQTKDYNVISDPDIPFFLYADLLIVDRYENENWKDLGSY